MLDVAEHREQEQARERGPEQLGDDVAGHAPPRESRPATAKASETRRVQVGARDRAHEQDDRQHHQPGRHHRRGEADLALGVQQPAAGRHEHEHERAEQLREQPPVLEARILELLPRAELERQQPLSPGQVAFR